MSVLPRIVSLFVLFLSGCAKTVLDGKNQTTESESERPKLDSATVKELKKLGGEIVGDSAARIADGWYELPDGIANDLPFSIDAYFGLDENSESEQHYLRAFAFDNFVSGRRFLPKLVDETGQTKLSEKEKRLAALARVKLDVRYELWGDEEQDSEYYRTNLASYVDSLSQPIEELRKIREQNPACFFRRDYSLTGLSSIADTASNLAFGLTLMPRNGLESEEDLEILELVIHLELNTQRLSGVFEQMNCIRMVTDNTSSSQAISRDNNQRVLAAQTKGWKKKRIRPLKFHEPIP